MKTAVWTDVCQGVEKTEKSTNVGDLTFQTVIYRNHNSIVWFLTARELLQSCARRFLTLANVDDHFFPAFHISRETFADVNAHVGERMFNAR